ncbi:hypothetical protein EC957_006438 [Mortierella hygrophila]|uniref:Uncharacterized protein n=1 Tax=Mortierella hygrophila TaxID=979708 RepID=A0A9P6EZP6_9FUNG|nr:hypothetical protein EC957_006438 [Mortierella hygrophila]
MTHRKVGNNRVLRKDESGTYYKDIVFVPSGSLSMNNNPSASTSSTRTKEEDINEIREFYKSVLSMPKTEAQPVRRRKPNVLKQVSGATKPSSLSGTVASTPTFNEQVVNTRIQYHIICSAFVKIECALTAANYTIKHHFTPTRIKHNLKHIDNTNTTERTSNVGRNCAEELEPHHPIRIHYHQRNITA